MLALKKDKSTGSINVREFSYTFNFNRGFKRLPFIKGSSIILQ
jgi:hypothetical protein